MSPNTRPNPLPNTTTKPGLKARLQEGPILLAPGVYDGMTAAMAEAAGFELVYLSGAAVSYTRLGRPDIGLTTQTEMAEALALVRDRIALPIVIDADTGHGNALNAQRTMRLFERAGANAMQIEDQTFPKRCGHFHDKTLISAAEMTGKIAAMADARLSEETLIIARTDAVGVEGFEAAMERAETYLAAGADMLFIEAPRSGVELSRIPAQFKGRVPLMANMVEGGETPIHSADELEAMGYQMVIFPGAIVRALARAAQEFYASLNAHGSNLPFMERMFDFHGLNRALGAEALLADADRFSGRLLG